MERRRTYTKIRRAESEAATRGRIVDAMIELHTEVGPTRTTVSAIAERAGVERLTVYRHFPDERSMLTACSTRWAELNPPPSIDRLEGQPAGSGSRRALLDLYRWYRTNERLLTAVTADAERSPTVKETLLPIEAYLDDLARAIDRLWPGTSRRRRATLRHVVEFATWRSLSRLAGGDRAVASIVLSWLG